MLLLPLCRLGTLFDLLQALGRPPLSLSVTPRETELLAALLAYLVSGWMLRAENERKSV